MWRTFEGEPKVWKLEKETEIRFELSPTQHMKLELCEGTAELFGTELGRNISYHFSDAQLAIYTWNGAVIKLWGDYESAYESDDTPMINYVNLHAQLEARREQAAAGKLRAGPKVLVVGPSDSGKSTLCRILCSYGARLERNITYVDLDVGQGNITVPGSIAASPIDKTSLDVEKGLQHANPIAYNLGHASPADNLPYYRLLVEELAQRVKNRLENDEKAKSSGIIVNSCGWVTGDGYSLLLHTAKSFEIDVVVVLGHDRLFADLRRDLAVDKRSGIQQLMSKAGASDSSTGSAQPTAVDVVKLPRSGGVIQRNPAQRRQSRIARIKSYFYGSKNALDDQFELSPAVTEIPFKSLNLFSITAIEISDSALPFGQEASNSPLRLLPVPPTPDLLHTILAIVHLDKDHTNTKSATENGPAASLPGRNTGGDSEDAGETQQILRANVAGFVCVQEVNKERGVLKVLAPTPGPLPSQHFIVGSVKWMEEV